jgi:anthranilate phosphoribosyltransferase
MIGDLIEKIMRREDLTPEEAVFAFDAVFDEKLVPEQIATLLTALRMKGETVVEISAAVSAMRARMIKATVREDAIDVCGTGGDGAHTLNISTAVAIVLAACGVPVAKHGNRAASSQSGATDVLSALGVNINAPQPVVERCVNELGIGYFAAPLYHPALKSLVPVRKNMGIRTLFNLLGPMCNPASVTRQMIGVYAKEVMLPVAEVMRGLGTELIFVVHGAGGMDELSTQGTNLTCFAGISRKIEHSPTDAQRYDLPNHNNILLRGGSPQDNAEKLIRLMNGEPGAYRDTVIMNAAFATSLVEAIIEMHGGIGPTLIEQAGMAAAAIDSGKAKAVLEQWIKMSNQS